MRAIDQCPPAHFLGKEVWPESGSAEVGAFASQRYDRTGESSLAITESAIKKENFSAVYLTSTSSTDRPRQT